MLSPKYAATGCTKSNQFCFGLFPKQPLFFNLFHLDSVAAAERASLLILLTLGDIRRGRYVAAVWTKRCVILSSAKWTFLHTGFLSWSDGITAAFKENSHSLDNQP